MNESTTMMDERAGMEKSNETVDFTLPRYVKLTGAREITEWADLSKATGDDIVNHLCYSAGVISQRAGAQKETVEEKQVAERTALQRVCQFLWKPGSGGGGRSISVEEEAERSIFLMYASSNGVLATKAEKLKTKSTRWYDLFLSVLGRKDPKVAREVVEQAVEKAWPQIKKLIDAETERLKEEEARKRDLAASTKIG